MLNGDYFINQIRNQLVNIGIDKLILFGSYASGSATDDSDIDLLVVDSSDFIPSSFAEKHQLYSKISDAIRDIKQQIPVDLIIHTKPMHARFLELNGMFCQEILSTGKIIYEKATC